MLSLRVHRCRCEKYSSTGIRLRSLHSTVDKLTLEEMSTHTALICCVRGRTLFSSAEDNDETQSLNNSWNCLSSRKQATRRNMHSFH